jgi:hypothetical protein
LFYYIPLFINGCGLNLLPNEINVIIEEAKGKSKAKMQGHAKSAFFKPVCRQAGLDF